MVNESTNVQKFYGKTFFIFSCILFVIIILIALTAYAVSIRQINHSHIQQQLVIASETIRLRLTTIINSDLALVLKMGDTPAIQQHFFNPADPVFKAMAHDEIIRFAQHLNDRPIFWISDIDKIFYSTAFDPFLLNPDDPENYWYNMTLRHTELFNLSISYNSDLHMINLWINVPVFYYIEGGRTAVGMVATGIDLTEFWEFMVGYKEFDVNITSYLFNEFMEITSAADFNLISNKVLIDERLQEVASELRWFARTLGDEGSYTFTCDNNIYLISSIPSLGWHLVVIHPLPGFLALNETMNFVFFIMLFLILLMFITINIFVIHSGKIAVKQNKQLIEVSRKAQAASQAKSNFLANMSHEIRTPMNAVTGMAELILRTGIIREAHNYALEIRQAGNNLISIINDILDLSKIEAGKLKIFPSNYLLASLINDVVSIIRPRMMEKPIRFFTNIESSIPYSLIGDIVRMRQILLNLLSNAVKYTERGHISLSISMEEIDDSKIEADNMAADYRQIWLKFVVADTGFGIKAEEQSKLFDTFTQIDTHKNKQIEGTGLGLVITKNLCTAMGGNISVKSDYRKGSEFTVIIPQVVYNEEPFATVEEPENKNVLVYERRSVYAESVCWTLANMNVPHTLVKDVYSFAEALGRQEWFFVFSGYTLYDNIKPILESVTGKQPNLALMVEWGVEAHIPNVRFLSLPVQSLSISNTLNGKTNNEGYIEDSRDNYIAARFTLPQARLLVVDDITTNLKIAEGLLAPYLAEVDICTSGIEAIELVKQKSYDLVFMDHMMPGMDGIETVAKIRAWENSRQESIDWQSRFALPIVALTANAVVGMQEMFLDNGFDDFLAKPIDISKLDEILLQWIPEEKKVEKNSAAEQTVNKEAEIIADQNSKLSLPLIIPGVDTQKGMRMTGGQEKLYIQVLSVFCDDVEERLSFMLSVSVADELSRFVTHVHALKSACGSIGAAQVSALAAELEGAGNIRNLSLIEEKLPLFIEQLAQLVDDIREALEQQKNASSQPLTSTMSNVHRSLFGDLITALKTQNAFEADHIIEKIKQSPLDTQTASILEKINNYMLVSDFDGAIQVIDTILNSNKQ